MNLKKLGEGKEKKRSILAPLSSGAHSLKDYLFLALIIIGVVALLLLAINQLISFMFKAHLLSDPCQVCKDLNPDKEFWFKEKSPYEIDINNPNIIILENSTLP